jgi:hypothetical protein
VGFGPMGVEFKWRRNLFVWEEERGDKLTNLLTPIQLSNSIDEWKCHYSTGGIFSVSSFIAICPVF